MIVRTSGPAAIERLCIMQRLPVPDAGGAACRTLLVFAGISCPAWVYLFRAPASYTGQDLVEYHLPGNPILAEMLLRDLLSAGLRQAEAGEFTARAYFNGRIDLTQAEGVAATVSAQSEQQLVAGRRLMEGELARRLMGPADEVLATLALLEVAIDFSDEDVTFLQPAELQSRVAGTRDALVDLLAGSSRFQPMGHEPTFVLVGRPNAGKSTLLNALAGYERAVASATAGTTRDALAADVALPSGYVRLIDVAGLDDNAAGPSGHGDTPHERIARQMAGRAADEMARADFVLFLRAADDPLPPVGIARSPDLCLRTKSDLGVGLSHEGQDYINVSAATGQGLGTLRQMMNDLAFGKAGAESTLALNTRHVLAVESAIASLDRALLLASQRGPIELIAAELRDAVSEVGAVVGQVSPDELLGRIFAQFCIGK